MTDVIDNSLAVGLAQCGLVLRLEGRDDWSAKAAGHKRGPFV